MQFLPMPTPKGWRLPGTEQQQPVTNAAVITGGLFVAESATGHVITKVAVKPATVQTKILQMPTWAALEGK